MPLWPSQKKLCHFEVCISLPLSTHVCGTIQGRFPRAGIRDSYHRLQ